MTIKGRVRVALWTYIYIYISPLSQREPVQPRPHEQFPETASHTPLFLQSQRWEHPDPKRPAGHATHTHTHTHTAVRRQRTHTSTLTEHQLTFLSHTHAGDRIAPRTLPTDGHAATVQAEASRRTRWTQTHTVSETHPVCFTECVLCVTHWDDSGPRWIRPDTHRSPRLKDKRLRSHTDSAARSRDRRNPQHTLQHSISDTVNILHTHARSPPTHTDYSQITFNMNLSFDITTLILNPSYLHPLMLQ